LGFKRITLMGDDVGSFQCEVPTDFRVPSQVPPSLHIFIGEHRHIHRGLVTHGVGGSGNSLRLFMMAALDPI
jgi:hypothetical protein